MSQLEITMAGCASALAVDALIYPLDTLKTRMQSPKPPSHLFRNLYTGVGPVVLATLPSASVFFLTYESARRSLSHTPLPRPMQYFAASTTAELASCAILTPVEVFKTVTQVSSHSNNVRLPFFQAIRRMTPSALRQGFLTLAGRNLPYTATRYETLRRKMHFSTPRRSKTLGAAASASIAGSIAAWVTTPIDVIKTRVMLVQGDMPVLTLRETMAAVWREQGALGFLRGAGLRAAWAGAGSGVYLGTYETSKLWLKNEL